MTMQRVGGQFAPQPTRAYVDASGRYVRERQGSKTIVEANGDEVRWSTNEWISDDFLARLKHTRDQERRAPLGDSHGAWQKVAEIPLSLLMQKLPPEAWEDKRALAKIVNDADLKYFRADGNHRRF
jgi:hypothetical protein